MTKPGHRGFDHVDTALQPESLVDYLDRVATSAAGTDYTWRTLHALGLGPGQRLLDVGSGSGRALQAAAEFVGPTGLAVGVDTAVTMATAARARVADHPKRGSAWPPPSTCRLPTDSSTAAALSGLQHLPNPARAVAEMARVTRSGGLVLIGDTDRAACVHGLTAGVEQAIASAP